MYHETATIPTNQNNVPQQHLYLPSAGGGVGGPIIRKPSTSPRLSTYNIDDKLKKFKPQTQKITKNVYVTPLVDVVIPQHSYQLNSDVYNNEVSLKKKKKQ